MRTTRNTRTLLVLVLAALAPGCLHAEELARFVGQGVPEIPWALPEGVSISATPVDDTRDALEVKYTGADPVSVMLFAVTPPAGVSEKGMLVYEAWMKGESAEGAYLEMLCTLDGSESFSRALNQAIEGKENGWRKCRTPFFLEKGDNPELVKLGVRFEGPGTLYVEGLRLLSMSPFSPYAGSGLFWGIAGGVLGIVAGIWGGMAGTLAPRGRCRALVMGIGLLLFAVCLAALVHGVHLVFQGEPQSIYWPWLLCGGIGTVVVTPLLFVVRFRYLESEMRRMSAMDLSADEAGENKNEHENVQSDV